MGRPPEKVTVPNNTKGPNRLKAAARERAEHDEIPYKVALARLRAEADLAEVPGAVVPAPVAILLARNAWAAAQHLGTFRRLTAQYDVTLPMWSREEESHPVAPASSALQHVIFRLVDWAGRTAYASGAVAAVPDLLGEDVGGDRAALYPDGEWCTTAGGQMPQPGEPVIEHAGIRAKVRASLTGPVPLNGFVATGDRNPARPAVEGTPAAVVWRAQKELERYGGQHWDRPGDSAADLAATLDGLAALTDQLTGATSAVLHEIEQRIADGRLTGVDAAAFGEAIAEAREVRDEEFGGYQPGPAHGTIRHVLAQARRRLVGARSALPTGPGRFTPRGVAVLRGLDGRSLIEMRAKLGDERHLNKQITKTTSTDYGPEDALYRALAWMHATDAVTYDHARHLDDEQAGASAGGAR